MDDAVCVGVGERVQNLTADADGLLYGQMSIGAFPNQIFEGLAFHVFKNDIGNAIIVPNAKSTDDILMGKG